MVIVWLPQWHADVYWNHDCNPFNLKFILIPLWKSMQHWLYLTKVVLMLFFISILLLQNNVRINDKQDKNVI